MLEICISNLHEKEFLKFTKQKVFSSDAILVWKIRSKTKLFEIALMDIDGMPILLDDLTTFSRWKNTAKCLLRLHGLYCGGGVTLVVCFDHVASSRRTRALPIRPTIFPKVSLSFPPKLHRNSPKLILGI